VRTARPVQLPRGSDETDTSLWFEFDLGSELTGVRGQADANDDLIGVVRTKGNSEFVDSYIDAGCAASNGQSVCDPVDVETSEQIDGNVGAPEASNGSGDTNGQFMFYEIAHPLCNTSGNAVEEARDFCVSVDSDELPDLGLFLRLSVGKNSQGGTTWPEFRDYHPIDLKN
jgi:hypothetical protein